MTTPRKYLLLIVEDDPDNTNLLQTYFSGHGFSVVTTARGEEALETARRRAPDLMLLDINLAGKMDGLAVCQELRLSPRTSHLPVIFLSERSAQSDRVAGLGAGAQDYVSKPYDVEELRLRVQNLITRTERENMVDPRTGLPTGRLIDEQLQRAAGQPGWSVLECRLDSFRPFLDVNGFVAGDDVLKFAGHLVSEVVEAAGTPDDFIGHPSNETFLIITAAKDVAGLRGQLAQRFNAEVQAHYGFMEREQGYIQIRDQRAPLMTLQVTARAA